MGHLVLVNEEVKLSSIGNTISPAFGSLHSIAK